MKRSMMCLALLVVFLVTVALPADLLAKDRVVVNQVSSVEKASRAEKRVLKKVARLARKIQRKSAGDELDAQIAAMMQFANENMAAAGVDYRWAVTEYLTESEHMGRTVFFNNVGNKQLSSDFVPGDPRRVWSGPVGPGDDITWASDTSPAEVAPPGLTAADTQAAIDRAMATWQDVDCSNLPLTFLAYPPVDLGFIPTFFGLPGASGIAADVTQAGFGTVLDFLLPAPIIAATFTLVFTDADDNLTDIDNNGKLDTALREIFYTNNFPWAIDGNIDVETVVLHETGHGLSQAHFGKLSRTDKNGKFHFSPRAVMNAGYTGPQQVLAGTDSAGHCSNWAEWPNN